VERELAAVADAHIHMTDCDGDNYAGGFDHVTLSAQFRGLLRFELDVATMAAWESGRITRLTLVLTRTATCGRGDCPVVVGGPIDARPLRVDWDEGPARFEAGLGADWCRRARRGDLSLPWGMAGASQLGVDIGPPSGVAEISEGDETVAIGLDPAVHMPLLDVAGQRVGVALWGAEDAFFTAASHESGTPSRLLVEYCP
jgi:hypothetical protein